MQILMSMNRALVTLIGIMLLSVSGSGYVAAQTEQDQKIIENILKEKRDPKERRGDRMARIAMNLNGTGTVTMKEANAMAGRPEIIVEGSDGKEFVENVIALVLASEKTDPDMSLFEKELDGIRYRRGENNGYGSRLIYGADWIGDNCYRGKIKELTRDLPDNTFLVKTLDYVSNHRDEFAGLRDSLAFERVKTIEMGYRAHKIPYMKVQSAGKKDVIEMMQNGDIILIVGKTDGWDFYDIGLLIKENGIPHLLHASESEGKILLEPEPLADYLKRNTKAIRGYRLLRIAE